VAKELSKFWHFLETGVTTEIHEGLKELQDENRRLREELEKRPTLEQMRQVFKDWSKEK
jgi:predicted nuclease with TOPRIM domain